MAHLGDPTERARELHLEPARDVYAFEAPGDPDLEALKFLLIQGFPVDYWSEHRQTALAEAARAKNLSAVQLLLEYGADPNARKQHELTPLHQAVDLTNHREGFWTVSRNIVSSLLARGADVNAQANGGLTPLFLAIHTRNFEVARLLLRAGADPNLGSSSYRPLDAAEGLAPELVDILLTAGACKGVDCGAHTNLRQ